MPARRRTPARPLHYLQLPLTVRPDGTEVLPTDRIVEALRLGASYRTAASRAGVSVGTLQAWMRSGARLGAALLAGTRLERDLTASERAELALTQAIDQAEAEHELGLLALLEQVSRGTEARSTTIKRDANGAELERTERTERAAPDAATIRWRLERGLPERWSQRHRVEHVGALQVDVSDRAAELADALRAAALDVPTTPGGNRA